MSTPIFFERTGRIVALYSVFNVEDLIYDSMLSVQPVADEIQLFDGRWVGFKCPCGIDHDNSCDKTKSEIDRFGNSELVPVVYYKLPTMPELDKRNAMLASMRNGDVILLMDDDELLFGDLEKIKRFADTKNFEDFRSAQAAKLTLLSTRHAHDLRIRLLVKTPGLHYTWKRGYGFGFKDDAGELPNEHTVSLPSVRFINLYGDGRSFGYRELSRDRARDEFNSSHWTVRSPV